MCFVAARFLECGREDSVDGVHGDVLSPLPGAGDVVVVVMRMGKVTSRSGTADSSGPFRASFIGWGHAPSQAALGTTSRPISGVNVGLTAVGMQNTS